ncbi:MAG: 3-deoxy-D-manno-octulosonic acid transferase [Candidatus Cloacimonetes bacterium]|nr:3-deoxy-D-manno-octulosonic acid transferase [Candidatus Cloacimonadota bacterium]MCF7814105.1 3-deoxy-D-manno-octulosonic acid transferase [Candidatus Cloacimonadota bacterium]MCF7867966.1 3-deoxy-D-manno-octulosonic acid transferase [Candidatus Cloacimonadota bacterium]MCF7883424.1 3-deoxy-D-manno-octulosonic acid transferase [Candidatus Cloacimonadota bacterium]
MFLYRFLTSLLYLLFWPFISLRFKGRERRERFGKIKNGFDKCVWIHAASMGEVNAVKTLITELLQKYAHTDFVLSTMTATGQDAARKISPKLKTIFLPLDFCIPMKRLFKKLNPELIILVETEFWPNMLFLAKKKKVPVVMVNARLSDQSYPNYRRTRFIWKSVWKAIVAVNAQSGKDAQRFENLKFNNVKNSHNLKFCVDLPQFSRKKLRQEIGYKESDKILVWGSSRPGEEKLLLKILHDLKSKIPNLKIIVVPRHLHRLPEVKTILAQQDYSLYSDLKKNSDILIIDEMGILNTFYALSDLAIVGGSFFNFGGHNPLEPAFYGIPTIIGNYHHSCRDSVDRLRENNGIIVSNKKKLADDIIDIFKNYESAKKMGRSAQKALSLNSDSLQINLNKLEKYLD